MPAPRYVLAAALLVAACDKGKPVAAKRDDATTAGATADANTASALDAASDAAAADAAALPGVRITRAGVGSLGRVEWWRGTEEEVAQRIEKGLAGVGGISVSFDVMDVPGEVEREEGYFSVKRGDRELIQVLRRSGPPDGDAPASVIVWTPEIATAVDLRVGDTVGAVLAKHPDLTCVRSESAMIAETVAVDTMCRSAREPEISYIVDARRMRKIKDGPVPPAKIAKVEIVGIVHEH